MRRVYMDSNATTPLLPEVFEAMRPCFIDRFGNASSIHAHGQQARAAVEHARESCAALLNCRASEIVFTSGGTEGDNLALFGTLQPGDHLITSSIEHHAVLNAAEAIQSRGVAVTFLPVDIDGVISIEALRESIRPETRLISIMMANNETGVIQPVAAIGRLAAELSKSREREILFHTDAVQTAGKLSLDVKQIGCHLLSISGHKMHAPQGTGILYVRRGLQLQPLFYGGNHERQRRAGTENLAGIVGLGKAAEIAHSALTDGTIERIASLRDRLEQGILSQIDACGVYGKDSSTTVHPGRVPNTTNMWFDHLEGEALVIALDLKGLAVSGGSACSSGSTEPSHVLKAMGVSLDRSRASLRFSISKLTTDADIDYALTIVPAAVTRLRELSPTWVNSNAAAVPQLAS